jgi:hypothetical protein
VAANDLMGLQRAVVELVTDDGARAARNADPAGYAATRLSGPAADALAGIDPAGLEAMTLSHVAKKERFDHLHRLHHELEARKAAERSGRAQLVDGHAHHHPHGEGHHVHGSGEPS